MSKRAALLAILLFGACARKEPAVDSRDQIPIACVLTALTSEQRARERVLLEEHLRSIRQVRERADGYSFRYPPDPTLFARMAELVALEHRCCPFLDFELEWSRGQDEPWLHIGGGARVKEFVVKTFTGPDTSGR
jgi:hypothetical protein